MDSAVLGQGLAFPVLPNENGTMARSSGAEKVRESIWLILSTATGERLMQPDFGCAVHDLVFQANTATIRSAMADKVRKALEDWEPRIDVLEVSAESDATNHNRVLVRISYRLRANNALFNLVYPLFLEEGVS